MATIDSLPPSFMVCALDRAINSDVLMYIVVTRVSRWFYALSTSCSLAVGRHSRLCEKMREAVQPLVECSAVMAAETKLTHHYDRRGRLWYDMLVHTMMPARPTETKKFRQFLLRPSGVYKATRDGLVTHKRLRKSKEWLARHPALADAQRMLQLVRKSFPELKVATHTYLFPQIIMCRGVDMQVTWGRHMRAGRRRSMKKFVQVTQRLLLPKMPMMRAEI